MDSLGQPSPQVTSGYAAPNYALQPTSPPAGCNSCSNGWTPTPGYTPSGASLPAAPSGTTPWRPAPASPVGYGQSAPAGQSGYGQSSQATPWRSVDPNASPSSGYGSGAGSQPASPWRSVAPDGYAPAPSQGYEEADRAPSLRPELPDDYSSPSRLPAVPMPNSMSRRINDDGRTSTFRPTDRLNSGRAESSTGEPTRLPSRPMSEGAAAGNQQPNVFATPTPRGNGFGTRPSLDPPQNQPPVNETRVPTYRSRAVRDLDREHPPILAPSNTELQDRTARARGSKPKLDDRAVHRSRYASVPIDW